MTHEQVLEAAIRYVVSHTISDVTISEVKQHLATCRQCWERLGEVHQELFATLPPELAEAQRLLGCREVRDRLWEFADVAMDVLGDIAPEIGAHLHICSVCQEEWRALHRALAEEDPVLANAPAVGRTEPRRLDVWRQTGQALYVLAQAIVIAVKQGAASFVDLPAGLTADSLAWASEPRRGAVRTRGVKTPTVLSLAVELRHDCQLPDDTALRVSLQPSGWGGALSAQARQVQFAGLTPGEYLLEIFLKPDNITVQIPMQLTEPESLLAQPTPAVQTTVVMPRTSYAVHLKWVAGPLRQSV
jgi:hypothetical protein